MTRIVTTTYRYKPPPKRKGRKLAEITGPAVVTAKGSRRQTGLGEAAAEVMEIQSHPPSQAGGTEPSTPPERQRDPVVTTAAKAPAPANDHGPRKSAIVTLQGRKTVQRQREQQQMAKLMATEVAETKDLVDRMMLGRWPGSGW